MNFAILRCLILLFCNKNPYISLYIYCSSKMAANTEDISWLQHESRKRAYSHEVALSCAHVKGNNAFWRNSMVYKEKSTFTPLQNVSGAELLWDANCYRSCNRSGYNRTPLCFQNESVNNPSLSCRDETSCLPLFLAVTKQKG